MIVGLFALPNLGKVVQLAALHKLPTIYPYSSFVRAGGLMSYGPALQICFGRSVSIPAAC
jgi:putative ABC transport system substrate-binding protein